MADDLRAERDRIREERRARRSGDCSRCLALESVLADRERELLQLKGPCRTAGCSLHHAHSGPCDIEPSAEQVARHNPGAVTE